MNKYCIVCRERLNQEEYEQVVPEFRPYPVHFDCFDSFYNADEFLEFARRVTRDAITLDRSLKCIFIT